MSGAPASGALLAHVLWLHLRGFADQPVSEQARRRERLVALAGAVTAGWDAEQRVVLEAADGLALVTRGDPRPAWDAARAAAAQAAPGDLGIGLHSGPVRALPDAVYGARLMGEGLDTAAALAALEADSVVVSESFREALATHAPRWREAFRPAGQVVDERLRTQPALAFDPGRARGRAQRRALVGLLGVVGLLGTGWAARIGRERLAAARRPAVLHFAIRPAGEVWIDGARKGSSPPLMRLTVAPGPHRIEIRHAKAKPLQTAVHLKPGEELRLEHEFPPPPPPPPPPRRRRPPDWLDRVESWLRGLR